MCFSAVLIFGNLEHLPDVEGAAIATWLRAAACPLLFYVRFVDDRLKIRFKRLLRWNCFAEDLFRYGFRCSWDIFWGINLAVREAIVGRLGPTALASVSIANTIFSMMMWLSGSAGASPL